MCEFTSIFIKKQKPRGSQGVRAGEGPKQTGPASAVKWEQRQKLQKSKTNKMVRKRRGRKHKEESL